MNTAGLITCATNAIQTRRQCGLSSALDRLALGNHSQKYELLTTAVLTLGFLPVASTSFLWGVVLWDLQGAKDSQWLPDTQHMTVLLTFPA